MNLLSHLQLYKKNWKSITALTVLAGITVVLLSMGKAAPTTETSIFLNIAAQHDTTSQASSLSEELLAADHLTEMVQGWMKNPGLISRVEQESKEEVSISARREEKQNLIFTYTSSSQQAAENIAVALKQQLAQDLQTYNEKTGSSFVITIWEAEHSALGLKRMVLPVMGVLLGLFLGILFSYLKK